ncbi:hypothetical protein E1A91_D01G045000v1 [Gossypium mustelinum]|uniref:Uncharacterized protein n=1 Tax=Gossypium mustelinum TaxID=34275 RepID=A0A5D2W4Y8_GOSMU|nr:hypothetical protein E1A91_D01G045000v1 [Gossypium mustelinum]
MDLLGPIFYVLNCLRDPTCTYIDQHRNLEERMNDLRARVEQLNATKRDVGLRIKEELRWGRLLREEVEKWILDVQTINDTMREINERMQNVSCFSRASLGKRVSQTVEQVDKIIERGKFTEALVINDPSTVGVAFQLEHLEGETIVKSDIWNYLKSDEIGMIGVCGMGGIGKTTIMKHIYNQLSKEIKPLFDVIIWVTVSKELNITKLQQDIANAMNIGALPEVEPKRVSVLMEELRRRKYVLILDDVWEKFSLAEVGIPKPTSSNGSKLVLTSRSIDVCRSMDCKIVKVHPLSNEESMNLFLVHTGHGVLKVPCLEQILGDIVRECNGLPLAIAVIAGSMKGIYDIAEWRNAVRELRDHVRCVKGTNDEIYRQLKFSFDRLGDFNIQNCFLYCSLYPEDYIIPRMELIEYWIDEGFLEIGSRQQSYDRGDTILNRLVNNCLLEKIIGGVKMHDVMRDTALYIKRLGPRFMVKAGIGLKELPSTQEWKEYFERVSFIMNKVSDIPPSLSPNCENLLTLLLQNNKSLGRISKSFFQNMHSLSILDLSYTNIQQLPNSVSNLEKLNALVLRGCEMLRCLPSLEKLKALRKLDLRDTSIEKVPEGLEMLVNLTYLDLATKSLKELPIAILPRLSCLQCLILYVESYTIKMDGLEAVGLRKLEIFEGRFSELLHFNTYCKSIKGQRLASYLLVMAPAQAKFDVNERRQFPVFLPKKEVILSGCHIQKEDPAVLSTDLRVLRISKCHNVRSLNDISLFFLQTNELRLCSVEDCKGMESVLDLSSSSSPCNSFEKLEYLWLKRLDNLRVLVKTEASVSIPKSLPLPSIFSPLKSIRIKGCSNIKQLFPFELAHDLQNLEKLVVCECWQMEEIIGPKKEEERSEGKGTKVRTEFSLPKLKKLVLKNLPMLKSLCSSNGIMICKSPMEIQVLECRNLKRMPLYPSPFQDTDQSTAFFIGVIYIYPKEWWESVEWDHPNAKQDLLPYLVML